VDSEIKVPVPPEPPRGTYPARVDEKGRLKLPVRFQEYLGELPEKKLFITSLDGHIARIYPISVWKENEKFFETFTDDPQAAEDVAFMANDLGSDVAVDSQGRLLLSPELRRELSLENQAVRLLFYKGRIDVYSENLYAERKQQASQGRKEKILTLERKGLK
jgi:MraZ protein